MTIFCVGTRAGTGRGGISMALDSLLRSDALHHSDVSVIESHIEGRRLLAWIGATGRVVRESKRGTVFWFHCGPWLSLVRKLWLALIGRLFGATVVFQFHSYTLYDYLSDPRRFLIVALIMRIADGVIVLTPWWRQQILSRFPESVSKVAVFPNGLGKEWIELSCMPAKRRNDLSRIDLISLGRLIPGKRFEFLIDVLQCLPDKFHLTVYGEGPSLSSLKDRACRSGLKSRVSLPGWLDPDERVSALRSSDIFCFASVKDSFGMVFLEAMAAGLPVVGIRGGAIPDVVPDGVAGILVSEPDPILFAEAILECVERREEFGNAGQVEVRRRFDAEQVGTEMISYLEALNAK